MSQDIPEKNLPIPTSLSYCGNLSKYLHSSNKCVRMPNKLGYKTRKYYTYLLKKNLRDILLQITLANNKAALLTLLHLCFKVSSITCLLEKTLPLITY